MISVLLLIQPSAFALEYMTPQYDTVAPSTPTGQLPAMSAENAYPTGVNVVTFGSTGVLTTDMNGVHVIVPNLPSQNAAQMAATAPAVPAVTCNCACPPCGQTGG